MRATYPEFDQLAQVLGTFHSNPGLEFLDAGGVLMEGWKAVLMDEGGPERFREQLQTVVDRAPTEEALGKEMRKAGIRIDVPEGDSWQHWVGTVRERFDAVAANPPSRWPAATNENFELPRASRFTGLESANAAATEVVRAHESELRAWASDPRGWWRHHFYADLGRDVGRVLHRGEGTPQTATAAVVIMRIDHTNGQPVILDAYPDRALNVATRERWPDLCHLFGGYFNQDWEDIDGTIWDAQTNFQCSTTDPARSRVRTQLDELLTLDDTELRHSVDALGSYVQPPAEHELRGWIERMRYAMDAFTWPDD